MITNTNHHTESANFYGIEFADDFTRATITVPIFHEGTNKKYLYWTAEMLKKVAPMFSSVPFRYDLKGTEGSSHAKEKLSSPHFDVGWTQESWYDPKTKTVWVRGEVTHPEVIQKLRRTTSDGKREVNFASMGILVDEAACSICGGEYAEVCENDHIRGEVYGDSVCFKVPTTCSKAYHVALTNDPADGEAEINKCIFQDLQKMETKIEKPKDKNFDDSSVKNMLDSQNQKEATEKNYNDPIENQNSTENVDNTSVDNINNNLNTNDEFNQSNKNTPAPPADVILKDLAERIKLLENNLNSSATEVNSESTNVEPNNMPNQINQIPENQKLTQPNMSPPGEQNSEVKPMTDEKVGQVSNTKVPENPKPVEVQEAGNMSQVAALLQQAIQLLTGGAEVQDMGKEAQSANKSQMTHDETKPTEHMQPGDAVPDSLDEGVKKNRENMNSPGSVAIAEDDDEIKHLKAEMADMKSRLKEQNKKLELQDQNVPEFGGTNANANLEVADMSANDRREAFGPYGQFEACFKGAASAAKFKR